MPYNHDDLTEDQRKVITDAEAAILGVIADTNAKLAETGIDIDEEGDFSCRICDCEGYTMRKGLALACNTPGCGHSFTIHRVQ